MKNFKTILLSIALIGVIGGSYSLYHTMSASLEETQLLSTEETAIDTVSPLTEEQTEPIQEEATDMTTTDPTTETDTTSTEIAPASLEQSNTSSSKETDSSNSSKESVSTTASGNKAPASPNETSERVAPTSVPTVTATSAPTTTTAPVVATSTPTTTAVPSTPTITPTPVVTAAPTKKPTNTSSAPNFKVKSANGTMVSLSSLIGNGKPVIVNFWASWCGPCKSEMGTFNAMYQEMKDKVTFVMVDMVDGSRETEATGKQYIASNGFSFPVYYDVDQSAAYAYSITNYPTTVFIDSNGSVSKSIKGALSSSTLRNELNKLLN